MATTIGDLPADHELEQVIDAFVRACPHPTEDEVLRWQALHPRYADDIADFARMLGALLEDEDDEEELDVARRAAALAMARNGTPLALDQLLPDDDDLPSAADDVDIDRDILAGIVAGRIHPPVTARLHRALAERLHHDPSVIEAAVGASHIMPRVGHAFSSAPPDRRSVSFRQAVEASGMSDERKAFWLGVD